MPSKQALDLVVALVLIGALIAIGWITRGWYERSGELEDERAQHAATVARIEQFDRQAANTLTALQEAKGQQTIIKREIVREVEKYRDRPCLDAGALSVLQQAADGAGAYRADGALPGDVTAPH